MLLPIGVADDCDRRVPAQGFFLRQGADDGGEGAPRVALLPEPDHGEVVGHGVGEDAVLGANVRVGRVRKSAIRFRVLLVLGKHLDHLQWLRVTGRSEEHSVDETEDSGVGANAERENDDGRDREPWRFEKLAQGELKILDRIR